MKHLLLSFALVASAAAQVSVLDTERLRIEQGKKLAAGQEMRVWNFTEFKEPMQDWPRAVKGAFVELRGEDLKHSEAALILVREDFRLRSFPANALTAADRALAEKLEAARLAKTKRAETAKPYRAKLKPYTTADANIAESEHFTFYYGNDRAGSGKVVFEDKEFLPRQQRWFEKVWTFLGGIGAPLPMAGEAEPSKINVYITGTGLAKHASGFAFGAENIVMNPSALGEGSSVVVHEFTHSVQYYSKGYRNSPFVGWFWECHGNWSTHQFMPGYPPVLAHYAGRAHYELNSTRHNYGSWPFLQTLAEHPSFGPAFPYAIWPACKRNERDGAIEDPFQTIMRVGTERGVWKEGVAGFGDIIGELAARMVAWDFQNQFYHQKELRNLVRHSRSVPSHRTMLEPVADRAGWWKPIFSHAPRQYGVNLVDLVPSAKTVSVDFAGIVDETEGSDWRVTLVASDALGRCRYSPTVRAGKLTLDVRDGEQLTLAVAATPSKYTQMEFRPGYGKKPRFPYEVTFTGAAPAATPPGRDEKPADAAPHPNGGGLVAKSAKVDATAYVGPNARVLDAAQVSGKARIEDHATVRQNARVSDEAIVGGFARVTDRAQLSGRARVRGFARLGDQATMTGNARLLEYASIEGRGTVSGDVLVKGFGELRMQPATELTGGAICGEDLEIHFGGSDLEKISGGMIYGYMSKEHLKREAADNRWLYARWNFDEPRQQVLKDANADCQGVLRAGAKFGEADGRRFLACDGKGYALTEGHVADTRDVTFDLQLAWAGGAAAQRVFEVGDADASVLLAIVAGGKPAFVIRRGKDSAALQSPTGLAMHRWTRVTVTLKDGTARLYLDGQLAVENKAFALTPEDVRARAGRIGAGVAGPGFTGKLDDFAVYRTGFAAISDIPAAAKK